MKQTVKEAAKEFAKSVIDSFERRGVPSGISDIKEMITLGFENGAEWQEKQSPWISIDEGYPEGKQPVLCSSQIYGKVVLCWDELSQTWNYPESCELYCEWNKVDCWMYIPEV
ncbi:hypothetical protein [Bacteroides clarus]|uniref:DUF551 domain-containing protein n=1 Tax=Bacteroides clarus TaxID=626929 RepID=A0A1Y3Z1R2_9BACE|nr:hypothetical protein [Bacteroides clarus]OUO00461.1 hypothetical protein B5F97_12040 [Bacteroides clarus]